METLIIMWRCPGCIRVTGTAAAMMWGSVPLVDGHLIDGDDVAMATLRAKQASVRAVVKKVWSLSVLILIGNQLKCYLCASMCFGYTGSLLLV